MSRGRRNGGTAVLITFAILAGITIGAVTYIMVHDRVLGDSTENIRTISEEKHDSAQKASKDRIIEDLLEPEIEVYEKEGRAELGDALDDVSLKEIQNNIENNAFNNYCYEHLDDNQKKLYSEIYGILKNFKSNILVSTKDTDELSKVFNCVMLDHPEIFYVTGYTLTKYTKGDSIENITLSGKYIYTKEEAEKFMNVVERVAAECIGGCREDDEYAKVKYVYEWLISRCDYVLGAENNQNILSVFVTDETVCQGYAKAAQYLLNKMDVFCILCEGEAMGSEAHVWNIVRIDGEYYYLDVTWGDATYTFNEQDSDSVAPPDINYEYMCVPYTEIAGTHAIIETVTLPVCNSMRDNYYVREGLYFEDIDESRLRYAFDNAYREGKSSVSIKCSSKGVFDEMERFLIDREHIFDYLQGNSKVNYVKMQDRNYFMFYLQ